MTDDTDRDAVAERLTFALVGARLGLWDWDVVTGATVFNERWAEIVGYTLDELQPTTIDTWSRLAYPADLPASEAALEAHFRGESPHYDVEVRMLHRDGRIVWVHDRGQVVERNTDGTPRRMVGTHEDITERVEATLALAESEERFSRLFKEHHAAMLLIDPVAKVIIEANPAAARLYGYPVEAMQGMPMTTIDPDAPELIDRQIDIVRREHGVTLIVGNATSDGRSRTMEVRTSLISALGTELLFSIVTDITEREQQAAQLREAAALFDAVTEGVLITDGDGRVLRANAAYTRLTGFESVAIVGHSARDIVVPSLPDERAAEIGWRHIGHEGSRDEVPIIHADGSSTPALVTVSPIVADAGQPTGYVVLVTDLSAHVAAERATLAQATTMDPVTSLPNRRGFLDQVDDRLSHRRRGERVSAVLTVDLDRFKDVNDSYGQGAGDEVLRVVADRLLEVASPDDIVARVGSDEFAIFACSVMGIDEADRRARDAQRSLSGEISIGEDETVFVTACIGVALVDRGPTSSEAVAQESNAALSDAKRAGPGSIRHHDDSLGLISKARLTLETELRRAWADRRLVIHYQPQMDVATGEVRGAEALLRWPTEDGGQVPPSSFIAVAEQIGLIGDIGGWVLDEACRQLAAWRSEGLPDLTMAVNVSAQQLAGGQLPHEIDRTLRLHRLPPRLLELELTETALLETGERTLVLLEELNSRGVRLSIDDFGTGYSSFAYLKRFPLDQLKIDRTFVSDLDVDVEDRAITSAIISLGHTLGLRVLAEGVESMEQLAVLRSLGCDEFQGYLVSPALPPDAFRDLVRATL